MKKTAIFDQFKDRHIGPSTTDVDQMLQTIGLGSIEELIDQTVPPSIRRETPLQVPTAQTEHEYLRDLEKIAAKNKVFRSFIGLGYSGTITPNVIARNIFHNPGWYTQYTPYQAEIAQGRLEALLNFQTMVSDLTAMPIANASLLDEATAAAEAMSLFFSQKNKRNRQEPIADFLVSDQVLPQTIDVLEARAEPLGIAVKVMPVSDFDLTDQVFGILLQYPAANGSVEDYRALTTEANAKNIYVTVAADLLALSLLTPPGEWGADAVVGNTQRFGIPLGYGGPHAAYFACKEQFKRLIPGRIIGVSVDREGKPALRMALQTREQHIRREKATSNICTAQALLAIMAGMYAAYHGSKGIKAIAERVHTLAQLLAHAAQDLGYELVSENFFDTITLKADASTRDAIQRAALAAGFNLYFTADSVQIALDETATYEEVEALAGILATDIEQDTVALNEEPAGSAIPSTLQRSSAYLTHTVFNSYHTETEMMRYIKRLENKDLSLVHAMIPLGSCTMKLNAATELMPVSWPAFANIHPYAPMDQTEGYQQIFAELEAWLSDITGFSACSLQPNSGAQGEYAGLLTIRAYHLANGDTQRKVAIIPDSAHGTNPASAVMAGMKVVVVKCDERGDIDLHDLEEKVKANTESLSCLMVTYPSTHGVFEPKIREICQMIHAHGGLVYMDGANMNAQVGLTSPGLIEADVCHLNLHKTFAIPHGGGGPGMGPICVNEKLAPFLPKHVLTETGGTQGIKAIAAAPWGSASILLISYAYIKMLGPDGLTDASIYAIINANYIKARLSEHYQVLFTGENGHTAHELILDLRPFKALNVSAEDVAKRLIDYGFHAPTLSWPVAGTIMIEPTESESLAELDRFCDAMISIRREIDEIAAGTAEPDNNVLHNAPHTIAQLTADEWSLPYSRAKAAWPLPYLAAGHKFWPSVARIDNGYGDRNLVCTCPSVESYAE